MYDVFLICPVRNATEEQKALMLKYIEKLGAEGKTVYYPARDTNQIDPDGGIKICLDNMQAISLSKEIHIFWDENSSGSLFDLGVAFGLGKPLLIVNRDSVIQTEGKSFANMILKWDKFSSYEG